jgi:FtsP/CotA-like multicopper oxidase with cupredoxin domain
MAVRDVYLKIQQLNGYSPVEPADHVTPPVRYRRDCMRGSGHEDGTIPADEVNARRLNALIYREYLDPQFLVPKPDKIVVADINEPAFTHRVPGTVIYAHPGQRLRIHVKNADVTPHSFHVHGLRYGIDSDGSWPFGTRAADGRRSDEICPGQQWTYTFDVTDDMLGAWPFHSHCRDIGPNTNRGLFGGIVVLERRHYEKLPKFPLPDGFEEKVLKIADRLRPKAGTPPRPRPPLPPPPPPAVRMPMPWEPSGGMPMPMPPQPIGGMAMPMPMRMPMVGGHTHGVDLAELPAELVPAVTTLEELAHAGHELPKPGDVLHVPLFFHQMSGLRGIPVFQSPPFGPGQTYEATFTIPGVYNYYCGVHGPSMSGRITVQAGGPDPVNVEATAANTFFEPDVIVGLGGRVRWTNTATIQQHSVIEAGGINRPSLCFNGRSFIGNTPTIVAHTGQRIRWYVFNLDLGMNWHNFHPHAQRWVFAGETIDIRSIGPAESFVVETVTPPVLLLPEKIHECQDPKHRPKRAKPYALRGDFLVHCHVEMHMMEGLAALVRAHQTVWLTDAQRDELEQTVGLPLDPGGNECPAVTPNRCATAQTGRWEELPGLPGITFMHAVLLPNTSRILFWGYGPQADQARLWDQATGAYTAPVNQPAARHPDQNIWSGAHAHLADAAGTILVHGGMRTFVGPPITADTERRSFAFDPVARTFTATGDMNVGRFYPTTITLADGRPIAMCGADNYTDPTVPAASLETFTPAAGGGSWSTPKPVPFDYYYYPWAFLLPLGDVFIAGPQKPARRFDPAASPITDNPALQYPQVYPQRGVNMEGTAVLLPLEPPGYRPRVLICGGTGNTRLTWNAGESGAMKTAEWIDLSAAAPAWQSLPDMNVERGKLNSVLLPDGRVAVLGGWANPPDGGPIEIFDPEDPTAGWELGPNMKYNRGYHSSAILMPDGSVVVGGDPNGATTPNERYLPSYFFKPRPQITVAPAAIGYGQSFSVQTPSPNGIARVVLMRPGAVTHAFNMNQRSVGCAITGASGTAVTATAPPDGNVSPPGHHLLFLIDHDRTPSEGVWIRLS